MELWVWRRMLGEATASTVLSWTRMGRSRVCTRQLRAISPDGSEFLTSMQDVAFVHPSRPGEAAAVRYLLRHENLPGNLRLRIGAGSQMVGSWVLASTTTGFAEIDRRSGELRKLSLPTASCEGISVPAPSSAGGASGTHSGPTKNCHISESPTHFVVDREGNIWFTNNLGGQLLQANPSAFRST